MHNVAILEDGSAIAWGNNGTSGRGNIPNTGGRAFVQVSAGCDHNVAILDDGSAIAWGYNDYGQCDIPDTDGRAFVQVSARQYHNVAILEDDSAIAWGRNEEGSCDCNIPDTGGRKFMVQNSELGRTIKSANKC